MILVGIRSRTDVVQVSNIDITGGPGQVSPPMVLVDRVLLVKVDLEEPMVNVTFEVLEPE